jgi:hypothetical protein
MVKTETYIEGFASQICFVWFNQYLGESSQFSSFVESPIYLLVTVLLKSPLAQIHFFVSVEISEMW